MEEEKRELRRLIIEDNVEEFERILNSNKLLQNTFNSIRILPEQPPENIFNQTPLFEKPLLQPLLLFAVKEKSQKVVEYLLSQDFVDKTISTFCIEEYENIYNVVCGIRGAEELFSIIERKVPHNLILNKVLFGKTAFYNACQLNNVFIVKRVYEILESLQVDLTQIKNNAIQYAIRNEDIEVIKYILSIDGIQLNYYLLFDAIGISNIDIVVYLLNVYLCQSIPSHLHNQFHIFQFSNHPANYINNINPSNNIIRKNYYSNNQKIYLKNDNENDKQKEGEIILDEFHPKNLLKRERDDQHLLIDINHNKKIKFLPNDHNENNDINNNDNDHDYEYYLKLVEVNFSSIMDIGILGNRIWHAVCWNENVDVVQLIYSLKGVQPDLLNEDGYNIFLRACEGNSNIKVIKFLHKLFPSFIHSQISVDGDIQTAASLVLNNNFTKKSDKLKLLHYLYLNGIDIHFLSETQNDETSYGSIYSNLFEKYNDNGGEEDMDDENKKDGVENVIEYLKVISQDFDYLKNEHDDEAYRKPSFWKEIDHNTADEESKRVNEWKNRYEEHVLRHLSKMIQEHMLELNQNESEDSD